MEIIFIFFSIPLIYYLNRFFKNKNYLINYSGNKHQKFTIDKTVPLTGGLYLLIFLLFFFVNQNLYLIFFFLLFFLIGISSDINLITSPKRRLFLQIVFVLFFVHQLNLNISDIRIDFLNELLENKFFSLFFITFCILILLNGSNFIDGTNTLLIGYYIIILLSILFFTDLKQIPFTREIYLYLLFFLIILFTFNFYENLFMGDSGAYVLALFFSYTLITIYSLNPNISPYFIVLLLWLPAFENFFSILRKFNFKKSPIYPDNNHLHQLLFFFLKKKFSFSKSLSNSFSSLCINIYNIFLIYIGSSNIYKTKFLLSLILINIFFYSLSYYVLLKYKKNYKK